MKWVKYIAIVCSVVIVGSNATAQQELQISQYIFNGLFLNPAYAGSHPYMEATALHRSQWTGFEGAPSTQLVGINGNLVGESMGWGATFSNDQIGDTRQTELMGIYSYHISLDEDDATRLSFGVRAGFTNYSSKLTETKVWDNGDPVFNEDVSNQFIPKIGAGAYIYADRWFAGISVPTLFAGDNNLQFEIEDDEGRYYRSHWYLNAGYVFSVNEDIVLKPSFLVKYQQDAPVTADINVHALYKEKFWLGVAYRTQDAVVGMVEYNITPNLRAGYAYDLTTSAIGNYSGGTHEIMLGYQFIEETVKMRTPRYF